MEPGDLRLFVALHAPEDSARSMLRALRKLDLPPVARHRETPLAQVHMTLQFIGDTPERDLDETLESVRRSAAGLAAFVLQPLRLITLPERGPPRLVAMTTDAPAPLLELQRRLAHRLARSPRAKAGDRFLPHLTLCRFSGASKAPRVDELADLRAFTVDRITLMKSVLRPAGAEHTPVERIALASD